MQPRPDIRDAIEAARCLPERSRPPRCLTRPSVPDRYRYEMVEQNPSKAAAWALTLSIKASQIRDYVSGLTDVILRTDTRVTNHGYVNGVADPIQSVLEAGTAVFVDKYGQPVVKCYCGNPLTLPVLYAAPTYIGPLWAGFSPTQITIINQSTTIINTFTLYDPRNGKTFTRTSGVHGRDGPYSAPSTTTTTQPQSTTPAPATGSTPTQTAPSAPAAENPSVCCRPTRSRRATP